MSDSVEEVKAMKHLQQAYSHLRNAEQALRSVEQEAPDISESFNIKDRRIELGAEEKRIGSNILVLREKIEEKRQEEDDGSEQQDDRDIEDRGIDRGGGLGDLGALQ
ncbi:hypothetical protein [Salinibacter virus M31CR41-3]|nr:hypothetical protein [Salinibacter virus M31CR41-3]